MTLLDIQNGANWDLVYTDTKLVAPGNKPGTYIPIPSYKIPVLFTSNIIAVQLTSSNASPSWYLGARLQQVIQSAGVTSTEYWGKQYQAGLNRTNLLVLPALAPQYALHVSFPRWIQDIQIDIAEYTGPRGEALPALERIEEKLEVFPLV